MDIVVPIIWFLIDILFACLIVGKTIKAYDTWKTTGTGENDLFTWLIMIIIYISISSFCVKLYGDVYHIYMDALNQII